MTDAQRAREIAREITQLLPKHRVEILKKLALTGGRRALGAVSLRSWPSVRAMVMGDLVLTEGEISAGGVVA